MKVVFAGPSLHGSSVAVPTEIELRPPARQGDLYRAVKQGAVIIGLIDGHFEDSSAVWHKEIVFALSEGVLVLGAASLGALRAAECAAFGMIGIGKIYEAYANGALVDDSSVAILHGPSELGYLPLTLPAVDGHATVAELEENACLSQMECAVLMSAIEEVHYKDRTWSTVIARCSFGPERADTILETLRNRTVFQKRRDAEDLIARVASVNATQRQAPPSWTFQRTTLFNRYVEVLAQIEI